VGWDRDIMPERGRRGWLLSLARMGETGNLTWCDLKDFRSCSTWGSPRFSSIGDIWPHPSAPPTQGAHSFFLSQSNIPQNSLLIPELISDALMHIDLSRDVLEVGTSEFLLQGPAFR